MQNDNQSIVTVRVWTSGFNRNNPGANVGHVSLETPKYYMSLWPQQAGNSPQEIAAKESEGLGVFSGISHEFLPKLDVDLKYEGREPEYTAQFSSLDVEKIDRQFEEFKQTLTGWGLLPGLCDNAESCATLAWKLLQAGEIKKLASSSAQAEVSLTGSWQGFLGMFSKSIPNQGSVQGSSFSVEMALSPIVKSPDALAALLKKAKAEEEKLHPQTAQPFVPH